MKKNLHILASLFIAFGLNTQNSEQISLNLALENELLNKNIDQIKFLKPQ